MARKSALDELDWEAFEASQRNKQPLRILNPLPEIEEAYFTWEGRDGYFPIPLKWLEHYARQFHFSNTELLAARVPASSLPPPICGIYFYFLADECVYVGQSNNISQRALQHRRSGLVWSSQVWLEVPHIHVEAVEAYYIRRLNPPHNWKLPNLRTYSDMVLALKLD